MPTLFLDFDNAGEAAFILGALDKLYTDVQKEIELCDEEDEEDAKEDRELWTNRANKYKKIIDELEKYIDIEDHKVWYLVKKPVVVSTNKSRHRGTVNSYIPLPCPKCGSINTVGNGYRKNKNGIIPKRRCKDCGLKYTNKDSYLFKMKFSGDIIKKAIELHKNGMSTRKVSKFILENYHVKISNTTVFNWSNQIIFSKLSENNTLLINDVVEEPPKLLLKMFKENEGFDYRAKIPKIIGQSEIYDSGHNKIVIRYKRCRGEIVFTSREDIDRLLSYNEKDFEWCIKNMSNEKRNILRGYRRDIKNNI